MRGQLEQNQEPESGAQDAPSGETYAYLNGGDFLAAVGDDASKWAAAFMEINPECNVEEDVLVGWFANAIEHSTDVRRSRLVRNGEAWLDFIDGVSSDRRFWAELALTGWRAPDGGEAVHLQSSDGEQAEP